MRASRRLKCIIVFCLCLLFVGEARADQQLDVRLNGQLLNMTSLTWHGEKLYASDGMWLYEIAPATGEAALHRGYLHSRANKRPEEASTAVVTCQTELLVADWHAGLVQRVEGNAAETVASFTLPAALEGKRLSQPVRVEGKMYFMAGQTNSDLWPELYCIELKPQSRVKLMEKNVYDLAPWTDGRVLVRRYDSVKRVHQVWALDGQSSSLLAEVEGIDVCGLAADPAGETFYLVQDTELMAYRQGKVSRVRSIPRDRFSLTGAIVNGRYMAWGHSGTYSLYDLLESRQRVLRIRGLYNELSDQGFATAHPEITLSRTQENDLCAQDVYTAILTGDEETDLYFIAYSSGVQTMMEQGYIAALDESAPLAADHARLHHVLAKCLQRDGQRYGVAAYVRYGSWGTALAEDVGFVAPSTLEQALEAQLHWDENEHNHGQAYMGLAQESRAWTALDWLDMALMQALLGREIDEPVALQSHAGLLEAMEQVKAAYTQSGWPLLPQDAAWYSFDQLPALLCFGGSNGYFGLGVNTLNGYPGVTPTPAAMPSPLAGEESRYPAVMMVYILNPRSQHKEEAVAYLEWLVQNRDSQEAVWLHQDGTDERVSREMLDFYRREIVPHMVVLADPLLERQRMTTQPIYPAFLEEMARYLTGMQTAQQCLAQMQRMADAWWLESR